MQIINARTDSLSAQNAAAVKMPSSDKARVILCEGDFLFVIIRVIYCMPAYTVGKFSMLGSKCCKL